MSFEAPLKRIYYYRPCLSARSNWLGLVLSAMLHALYCNDVLDDEPDILARRNSALLELLASVATKRPSYHHPRATRPQRETTGVPNSPKFRQVQEIRKKFVTALKRTDPRHVVNFITQNRGKKTTTRCILLKKKVTQSLLRLSFMVCK